MIDQKIYCSLDIETSGFDPLKDEILEVGFVKFQITNSQLEILEEWTQVFRPSKPVEAKILGLTGIKQAELDSAPNFSDFKYTIQEKIGNTVIVGHNVVFDIKFLESRGIQFSGQVVDTLDLVQWLLPTHHSYNLENLMHYFKVEHKDAHRALADAKAALQVLQKLLALYSSFESELQEQIQSIIMLYKFDWTDLLNVKILEKDNKKHKNTVAKKIFKTSEKIKLENNTAYNFQLGENYLEAVIQSAVSSKRKLCLVLPKKQQVVSLWKAGLGEPFFGSEEIFSPNKFSAFLSKKLSVDEAKFALKILVWRATNWQNHLLFDLNLSFFGGQFKEEISGGENLPASSGAKLVCIDSRTLMENPDNNMLSDRKLILVDPAEFESVVSENLSQKISWGGIIYLLKSVYNPETREGQTQKADHIRKALDATDLFFGLVSNFFSKDNQKYLEIPMDQKIIDSEVYGKVEAAAENYATKIKELNVLISLKALEEKIEGLLRFFVSEVNRVKWLELGPGRLVFHNSPLDISEIVEKKFSFFKERVIVGSLGTQAVFSFFLKRLGLNNFSIKNFKVKKTARDLFTSKQIKFFPRQKNFSGSDIDECLSQSSLPATVLFGSQAMVKDFFEANYLNFQNYAFLLNQGLSGGSNKLLRNFSIHTNSLLLATDRFIIKHLSSHGTNHTVENLEAKTLVLTKLPFEQFTHPYAQALLATFENPFEEYTLPRTIYGLHRLLGFFYTPKLKKVFLFDTKLSKPYAEVFYEYFKQAGNFDVL